MSMLSKFFEQITDVSYQSRLMKESNITEDEFRETVNDTRKKIFLKPGETVIYHEFSRCMEPRAVREWASGRSGIRVARGVWIGGTRGRAESHYELRVIDYGALTITNKRIIFSGKFRSQSFSTEQIAQLKPHDDAIQIDKAGRQTPMYFSAVSGMLPYLAIKDHASYSRFKEVHDYFKFLQAMESAIGGLNFHGKFKDTEVMRIAAQIESTAKELEIEYRKSRLDKVSLRKLNSDIEKTIDMIRDIAEALRSTSGEMAVIESQLMKNNKRKPGLLGSLSKLMQSEGREVEKIFRQKHGVKPGKKIEDSANRLNEFVNGEFAEDIRKASEGLQKEYSDAIKDLG